MGAETVYVFHSFRVDPARRLLLRGGRPVSVTAKVFDLLRMFLLEQGALMRDEDAHAEICIRAARLLAESDQFQAAVDLLAACRSWVMLGDLVEKHAPLLASQGRVATVFAALELMPPELRDGRAWLVYWRAVFMLGRAGSRAQALAESAFHAFRRAGDPAGILLSWSLLIHAIATAGDDLHPLDGWLVLLDEMALAPPSPAIAAQVELSKLVAHFFRHTPCAVEVADAAVPIVIRHGTADEAVIACGYANCVFLFEGDVERARDVQRLLVQLSTRASDPLARIFYLYGEALRANATGRPRVALRFVEQGLALAGNSGIHSWDFYLLFAGALGAIGLRDFAAAERMSDAITHGPEKLERGRHCGYGLFLGSRVISRLVSAAFEYGIQIDHARELQQAYELEPPLDSARRSSPPS